MDSSVQTFVNIATEGVAGIKSDMLTVFSALIVLLLMVAGMFVIQRALDGSSSREIDRINEKYFDSEDDE